MEGGFRKRPWRERRDWLALVVQYATGSAIAIGERTGNFVKLRS